MAKASTSSSPTCNLALSKSGPELTHIGDVETFTYAVTTTGSLAVQVDKAEGLTDDKCGPVTYAGGDADEDGKVDLAETWTFTCDYTVNAEHVSQESTITNTAVVTGTVQFMSSSSRVARTSTYSGGCDRDKASWKRARSSGGCDSGDDCKSKSSKAKSSTYGGDGDKCDSGDDCKSKSSKAKSSTYGGDGDKCDDDDDCKAKSSKSKSSKAKKSSGSSGDKCPVLKTVTLKATAKWTMRVVFPGIDVTKIAAESRVANGGTIHYTVTVKNTGDVDLTVVPSDVGCTGFDSNAFALGVGQTKTLTCTHVASYAAGSIYHNEACATGTDAAGGKASDCDNVDTPIDPPTTTTSNPPTQVVGGVQTPGGGQVVAGERITPGTARLLGRTGCASRAFQARVRGSRIARVVFVLDGKRIKTVTKRNRAGNYAVRINPKTLRLGVHRLVATVTFQRASRTRAKRLRLSFQRCARALQEPRFTG